MNSHHTHPDAEDLKQLSADDEAAYRRLYDRYGGRVFSLAYVYLKSETEAQDIVQEVFLKVWARRSSLSGIENFNGWLQYVTRNLLIDSLRKYAREDKFLTRQQAGATSETAEVRLLRKETAALIRAAIDQLSPRQKQVYLLAREEGLSHGEIAEKLQLSRDTVKEHMKQALRNLRSYLEAHLGVLAFFLFKDLF